MISTYTPPLTPIGNGLLLSALVALLPLLTIFITLGALRWKAHWAGLAAVAVAIVVAVLAFKMPVKLAALSATEGAVFGLFPIMWIVFCAIVLYQITVVSGRFDDLRATFHLVSDDPRIQAIIIAFCFGAMLEALAGFGAPVAITGVMLMAVGFSPLRAAAVALLANTAPVAFGAVGTPIITAGSLTKIDYNEIGAYVGHQTPVLAFFVPLLLTALVDGVRGMKQTWPIALVAGFAFGIAQWVSATWISVELTDVIASLVALAACVLMLRVWQPKGRDEAKASLAEARRRELGDDDLAPADDRALDEHAASLTPGRIAMALFPYLLVIVVFAAAKLIDPIKEFLVGTDRPIKWPGLYGEVVTATGAPSKTPIYNFQWLSSPGSLLLICSIIVALVYRVSLARWAKEFGSSAVRLRFAFLTVASVLALAYVMNLSGQTITVGTWIAGAGTAFAFLSPVLGWLGTAVTGSDTSANALFATLQQTAAKNAGLDPTLLVAANSSGGVVGKMISPQNLTIAATSVGLLGQESAIFRKVLLWSLGLLAVMCVLVGLQATVLAWMLP
ncbi:L-lactate permease [Calidifontibacter sp. DB0510]|uniref:L-lactate permease n=1 Tax=Metallococcus carri TaxID=1656884 RepID=A0A967E933_9MICO|nr:L-lactate permease [Metallococcus carri]NHN55922.1 L-lactate permease [Metallococcus carri]NOP38390.1 L-lactate permease [Calidifontibacter sp. DB2511S]